MKTLSLFFTFDRGEGSHQGYNGTKKDQFFSLCHYVPTMSLCCVVHTGDTKQKREVSFENP